MDITPTQITVRKYGFFTFLFFYLSNKNLCWNHEPAFICELVSHLLSYMDMDHFVGNQSSTLYFLHLNPFFKSYTFPSSVLPTDVNVSSWEIDS